MRSFQIHPKRKRNGDPESLRAETVQSVIRFIELYHDEYMGVNMAGYKKYLYQVYCIYNGSSKKKVLPMKF